MRLQGIIQVMLHSNLDEVRIRKKGKPEILTSSPNKNALRSAIKEKDEKIKNKAIAAQKKKEKKKRKRPRPERKG